jgi:hypothetical protein
MHANEDLSSYITASFNATTRYLQDYEYLHRH